MTIRKRLFISNILMVLVPVFFSLIIGSLCIGVVWYVVEHGTGTGFEDSEDFSSASRKLSEKMFKNLNADKPDFTNFEKTFKRRSLTVDVAKDGNLIYSYGEVQQDDEALHAALDSIGGDGMIVKGRRNLYARTRNSYQILLYGSNSYLSRSGLLILSLVLIVLLGLTCFCSIFLTDRFLMRFVFSRIEEPLDLLGKGVKELKDGNLDYRIEYNQDDEFTPLCTAFNKMAFRLDESIKKVEQDNKSRKELIAGISHDIRSPLTSIQAYVEGLLDDIPQTSEARKEYLLTIKSKAEDIARMVSQLFLFSKLEVDGFPMPLHSEHIDSLIATWVDANTNEYLSRGLRFDVKLENAVAILNNEQFLRVLDNIAQNSTKYKTKAMGCLTIVLKNREKDVLLRLYDDGPGVAEADLERIMDVFYRTDPARQHPNQGSGLGLAITTKLIERMGGTIKAGKGPLGGLEIAITLKKESA